MNAGRVVIIGAGIAGLAAATDLRARGFRVRLLDKGRNLGGRLATRSLGGALLDHGAPCFAAAAGVFDDALRRWAEAGLVRPWGGSEPTPEGPAQRWRGVPSMAGFAAGLAAGTDVLQPVRVLSVSRDGAGWRIHLEEGADEVGDALILTAPVPQSLAILDEGGVEVAPILREELAAVAYDRCLAVLAVLEVDTGWPRAGLIEPGSGPLARLIDNRLKGVSSVPAVTLHATPEYSLRHWDRDRSAVAAELLAAADPRLEASVREFRVHGWRYARPRRTSAKRCAVVSSEPLLVVAGDGFGRGDAAGAFASGLAAAALIR